MNVFVFPLSKGNRATFILTKLPISKNDVDIIKGWIDLMCDAFMDTEEFEKAYAKKDEEDRA